MTTLIAAYGLVFAVVGGYVARLVLCQRRLTRRAALLRTAAVREDEERLSHAA